MKRYSLEELKAMRARGEAAETPSDAPQVELDTEFWRNARLVMPDQPRKTSIHLRVDSDVLNWFRSEGKGHLSRMNAVLKAYVEAQRHKRSA
mgnify:CR=1 FL=1